jgi:hypothetical protein
MQNVVLTISSASEKMLSMNTIVVRYVDGRVAKGTTNNFLPTKDRFNLFLDGSAPGAHTLEILLQDLKAIFFVNDLAGSPEHSESNQFTSGKPIFGRKISVVFKDGEIVVGTTQGYQPGRLGFFVVPADEKSNNSRCFIVTAATQQVSLL